MTNAKMKVHFSCIALHWPVGWLVGNRLIDALASPHLALGSFRAFAFLRSFQKGASKGKARVPRNGKRGGRKQGRKEARKEGRRASLRLEADAAAAVGVQGKWKASSP